MVYKNGECMRDILGLFILLLSSFLYFGGVFNNKQYYSTHSCWI